jgi:hypothetical protein
MVSSIDIYLGDNTKPYNTLSFKYNNGLQMSEIKAYHRASDEIEIWKKNGNQITYKNYIKGQEDKYAATFYKLNSRGEIAEKICENYSTFNINRMVRTTYTYNYDDDGYLRYVLLVFSSEHRGKSKNVEEYASVTYYGLVDGNIQRDKSIITIDKNPLDQKYTLSKLNYFKEFENDTNVDFYWLFCREYEMISDWTKTHSVNLRNEGGATTYSFNDETGNLDYVYIYNIIDGSLTYKYKINYL